MIDISVGINLFNESDFFSAHDFFEDIWIDAKKDEKEFFQGLVQISVGCYHLICGNKNGAISQLTKAKSKLKKYEPVFYKVNLSSLISSIDELLTKINSSADFNKEIPKIDLIN